ncbi:MAG: esterase-like activity of phytase family protein [Deltaproteobacteria bacterium]|nr:esterase-like activity of phytase family protein [Deltaproteobacteria bacterium]
MKVNLKLIIWLLWLANLSSVTLGQVTLIKELVISGKTKDKSNDKGFLENGTPANQLGGPSGMVWTGKGLNYLWLSDRGPKNGETSHTPRFHVVNLDKMKSPDFKFKIQETVKLKRADGVPLTGNGKAFDQSNPKNSLRMDPEGITLWNNKIVISEEYGPNIRVFDDSGKALADWSIPEHFHVASPSADESEEMAKNKSGRQPNAGFEGVTIDGHGGILAILQRPLLQDGGLDSAGKKVGTNIRMLNLCGPDCKPRELVYTLDDKANGVSEICYMEGSKFLAIERDGKEGKFKKIMLFDTDGASDVSNIERLPSTGLPQGVVPVRKKVLIDLLNPKLGLAGKNFPEKIEGLATGPDTEQGQKTIFVASDNDFEANKSIHVWLFSVSSDEMWSGKLH